ncbi:hypothetical protein MHBO_003261 [Bonamia ostreae]|uniref:Uncharacterized protein n=1 Tax=Bonamia ostreae TaxID=126728 RepID=A0ABV2AQI7_9EUKA
MPPFNKINLTNSGKLYQTNENRPSVKRIKRKLESADFINKPRRPFCYITDEVHEMAVILLKISKINKHLLMRQYKRKRGLLKIRNK